MPLSEDTIKFIAKEFDTQPQGIETFMQTLQEQGVGQEDINKIFKQTSVDLDVETREFGKGVVQGATLGFVDPGAPDPRAGDVELPFFGEISPSRVGGEIAGTLPVAIATRGVGLRAAAGINQPLVRKGVGIAIGEALPGTAQGLIRSEGDLEEGLKMAAVWTATGFLGEAAFAGIGKAFKQFKAGDKVTEGIEGLREMKMRLKERLEGLGVKAEQVEGRSLEQLLKDFPDLARAPDFEDGMADLSMTNALKQMDNIKASTTDQELVDLMQTFNHDLGQALTGPAITPNKRVVLQEQLSEAFSTAAQAVRNGLPTTEAARLLNAARDLTKSPKQVKAKMEALLKEFGEQQKATPKTPPVEEIPLVNNRFYVVRTVADEEPIVGQFRGTKNGVHQFDVDGEARFLGTNEVEGFVRAPEARGGGPGRQGPDLQDRTPASRQQMDQMEALEEELAGLGGEVTARTGDQTLRNARTRIVALSEEIRVRKDAETARQVNRMLREEGAFEPALAPGPRASRAGRRRPPPGEPDPIAPIEAFDGTEAGIFSKFLGAASKRGLGKNPIARELAVRGQLMFEDIGADVAGFWQRYQGAMKTLDRPSAGTAFSANVNEFLGGAVTGPVKRYRENQQLLIRALDGVPDSILEANPHLVPAYNELRTIFDELASRIGLTPGDRVTNYFPHLFRGPQGKWMAQRLKGMTGGKGKFIDEAAEEVDVTPLSALFERAAGAEGFDLDLDSVMHTYIRGAIEKPAMEDFAARLAKGLQLTGDRTQGLLREYGLHVLGKPGPFKKKWAHYWQNNELFNRWVDQTVEGLGDLESRGLLQRVRDGVATEKDQAAALNFFNRLIKESNTQLSGKQVRASAAKKIEEIRQALVDPNANPIVLDKLYKVMVINKLGFSASHYITNLTQTLTNTYPELGSFYTARGISHALNPTNKTLRGRPVRELLEESKVLNDTPEAREFMQGGLGIGSQIEEIALKPADWSERFNRSTAFLGAYDKFRAQGIEHGQAMIKARRLTIKTQFAYNRAGAPLILHPPSLRSLLMFRSFASHQIDFTADLIQRARDGDGAPLRRMMMAYLGLAGVGSALAGGFGARGAHRLGEHPGLELGQDLLTFNFTDIGGPPADALLDLVHGRMDEAAKEVIKPTIVGRLERASEAESPGESLLEVAGLRR